MVQTASPSACLRAQVAWTPRHVVIYPAICSLAGLVAGMFGVGGGIVKVTLWLLILDVSSVVAGIDSKEAAVLSLLLRVFFLHRHDSGLQKPSSKPRTIQYEALRV